MTSGYGANNVRSGYGANGCQVTGGMNSPYGEEMCGHGASER
jgi:hypothetical protein